MKLKQLFAWVWLLLLKLSFLIIVIIKLTCRMQQYKNGYEKI